MEFLRVDVHPEELADAAKELQLQIAKDGDYATIEQIKAAIMATFQDMVASALLYPDEYFFGTREIKASRHFRSNLRTALEMEDK